MEQERRRPDGVIVVTPPSDLFAGGLPVLEERLEVWLADDDPRVVLDLSHVQLLVSTGAGFLLHAARRLRDAGGGLAIAGVTPRVRSTLAIMGLLDAMRVHETLDEAVASLKE